MPIRSRISGGLAGLARAYLAGLFGWLALRLGFGEQWWWLFLLNSFKEILMWVLRIDYIFHSRHWQARSARIGPWDGVSDHRPVIATLVLTADPKRET
jgi:hypothetical protein